MASTDIWDRINAGIDEARRAYYDDIEDDAKGYKRDLEDGTITTREQLLETIDQDTDDSQWVIYTFKAKILCLVSRNENAYSEEMGEEPSTVEARACMAMRRDTYEALETLDVDMNAPFACKECETTHEDKDEAADCCSEEEAEAEEEAPETTR